MKIPKAIGARADLLYKVRQKRYAIQKQADALRAQERELEDSLIRDLPKSDSTGVAGRVARVRIIVKDVPVVEDWDKFYKHVKRTGTFEYFQRRLNVKAVQERWADKKAVPGVGVVHVPQVSLGRADR